MLRCFHVDRVYHTITNFITVCMDESYVTPRHQFWGNFRAFFVFADHLPSEPWFRTSYWFNEAMIRLLYLLFFLGCHRSSERVEVKLAQYVPQDLHHSVVRLPSPCVPSSCLRARVFPRGRTRASEIRENRVEHQLRFQRIRFPCFHAVVEYLPHQSIHPSRRKDPLGEFEVSSGRGMICGYGKPPLPNRSNFCRLEQPSTKAFWWI